MDYISRYASPLGAMTMASDGVALVGLWFDGQKHYASTVADDALESRELPIFVDTRLWLDSYFAGHRPVDSPHLALRGSNFRRGVWQWLRDIPYGTTVAYGLIAQALNCRSAQAVGAAVGHNPISLIIPCHRVVAVNGIGGYAAGVNVKRALLDMEGCRL